MYTADLTDVKKPVLFELEGPFRGSAADGRELGFTNAYMTLNGRPYFGISGEVHFCRVSPDQWEDTLVKAKLGGVNIISTYVFWIVHEETEGTFRFDGCRDLRAFLGLCRKHGLMVILRVGPFAHGEMRNGGLPDWLYGKPFEVRGNAPGYLECVRRWYRAIHGQVDGLYFSQNGPVVGIQIENEYMHSSAPWELTTGISNEWVNGGSDGDAHMLALKRIAVEEGLVTPFYTCTAWGGAMTPTEEMLPLWGGYAYQPWLFYSRGGEHPCTPEYIYRDNHNDAVTSTYNFEPRYKPESRPYACCEMMGGMMCSYNYRFTLPMHSVDALANIKLGSGCALLGYYMYRGGTTPTGERTPFLNEGQVPKRSYDYQAAIGEFGQLRESWYRLRTIHEFCRCFVDELVHTRVVLPPWGDDIDPKDAERLRYSVRVNGNSGFVFLNNFQDHLELPDRREEAIELRLPGETLRMEGLGLDSGENAILPFNLDVGGALLKWAAAQPITRLTVEGQPVHVFFAPDGMTPAFHFDRTTVKAVEGCETEISGDRLICCPAIDSSFLLRTGENEVRVLLLSRDSANRFSHATIHGREVLFLSDAVPLWDGERLSIEMDGRPIRVLSYPAGILEGEGKESLRMDIFEGYTFYSPTTKIPELQPVEVGVGRYAVSIPTECLTGHKTVLLNVDYTGDIGHAFIDGEMISDNFCNGQPWAIRLDCWREALREHPLTLYIAPIREGAKVSVDSAMAARLESVTHRVAELHSLGMTFVDEMALPLRG